MKKLITIAWSISKEVDLPDNVDVEQLFEARDLVHQGIESEIIRQASLDINWKDGQITGVDDIPDDLEPEIQPI